MIKKFKINPSEVSALVEKIAENCQVSAISLGTIKTALDIAERYNLTNIPTMTA